MLKTLTQKRGFAGSLRLKHPVEELKTLGKALKMASQPGLSREQIRRSRMVIREARAYQQLFTAYVRYQKFRVKFLEQQFRQAERGK